MSNDFAKQTWAIGGMIFAATMMLVMGIYQVIMGFAAILEDQVFVVASDYVYGVVNTMTWGWIHVGIGGLAVLVGIFLYGGWAWARGIGIALAVLSAIGNFAFLPYYPLWSIVIIGLDVFVIWSLAVVNVRSSSGRHYAADADTDPGEVAGRRMQDKDWPQVNAPTAPREADRSIYPGATADPYGDPAAPQHRPEV